MFFFFSVGNFWQKNDIFINLILIYCKIKEEDQGEEGKASEEVTLLSGLKSMLRMWDWAIPLLSLCCSIPPEFDSFRSPNAVMELYEGSSAATLTLGNARYSNVEDAAL